MEETLYKVTRNLLGIELVSFESKSVIFSLSLFVCMFRTPFSPFLTPTSQRAQFYKSRRFSSAKLSLAFESKRRTQAIRGRIFTCQDAHIPAAFSNFCDAKTLMRIIVIIPLIKKSGPSKHYSTHTTFLIANTVFTPASVCL